MLGSNTPIYLFTRSATKKKTGVITRLHRVGRRKDGVVKVLRTVGRRRRTQKVDPLRPGVGGKLPGVDDAVNKLGSLQKGF